MLQPFTTRDQAHEHYGVRLRVHGCKAMVVKSNACLSYLHCKHWDAEAEPCGWKAVVKKVEATG
eukprot:3564206-Karenia_brevis.AAC.1